MIRLCVLLIKVWIVFSEIMKSGIPIKSTYHGGHRPKIRRVPVETSKLG
jgi:hypothetical protein